ncbi:nuclear pore complex protein Nup155 [Pseudohyphozyma bogoriensis]|nr:nuclear pore complex protein Nup155 [Pseudohyphozyma bogoriensis]
MGLLPEIERSWVTVDHRLLLWDWADGSSFSTFEELTDVIVGVGLVRPRPGVFVDSISHLLVLTTPNLITLVGLGYSSPTPGAKPEITFYLTGLSVPTDGISLTTVKGTASGRIFLSSSPDALTPGGIGGDGCLYELVYQSSEGWFAKRCTLHNLTSGSFAKSVVPSFLRGLSAVPNAEWVVDIQIDDERGLLYTLLRNGAVEMWQLPSTGPGKGWDGTPNKVTKAGDILRQAQTICPGSPMLNGRSFKIVGLEIVNVKEGGNAKIGLVAITSTGVRLYFSHQRRGYSYYTASVQPSYLELIHVRPPPSPSVSAPPAPQPFYSQQPAPPQPANPTATPPIAFNSVIQGLYAPSGLLLASNNLTADIDVLLLAAPDVASLARNISENPTGNIGATTTRVFTEVASTIEVSGRTWDMKEITPKAVVATPGGGTGLNELATQVGGNRREWVVLTNMGANVVARQRPVDTLVEVLEAASMSGGGANGEIGVFFESYGRDQSCAMLLTIAAGNSKLGGRASELSQSYTARFGASGRSASSAVAESARSLFFEGGGRPISVDRGGYGSTAADSKIIFSGRHEGLAFYFARLIRPIWKQKITRETPTGQTANVSDAVLSAVQTDLISLRAFVEQEQQLFTLLPDGGRSTQPAIAFQTELTSLAGLRLLLNQSVEAISFVLLLIDYKISDIIAACDPSLQKTLLGLTYQELLTTKTGREVARALVSAVINQQIGRQLSVDAISDTLQQRCGSFCSADDVLLYKAIEAIRRAKDTSDHAERIDSLRESLRLFTKATKHLSFERLQEVCGEYNSMRYHLGSIDLAINCAHEWDPTDKAVSYWLSGTPPNDPRATAYESRIKCYSLVFATLQAADELLNEASQPNRIVHASAPAAPSYEEADGLRTNAYNKALSVKDEFFHYSLYDWYLARGMTDQLLETRTEYLEGYLAHEPTTLEKSDLLWQLYVRTSRYGAAASVLAGLADTPAFPLSLHKRVEYLALAVGNAKSQFPTSKTDSVQFLTEVEEKLEVAQVQVEIFRAIEELSLPAEEKAAWLEKCEDRLYTISELYSEFAEPLALLEIVLLIFHVADHRDPELIAETWNAILERVHNEAAERRLEALSAKVVDLGRRFHSSDVSFPLATLAAMLEKYSYDNKADMQPGWVPLSFREAGVPWRAVFASFDELFTSKLPPWHTNAALVFLATDITCLLEAWLTDAASTHSPLLYSNENSLPAADVDSAVGRYLMALNSAAGGGDVVKRLTEVQREIRRRF